MAHPKPHAPQRPAVGLTPSEWEAKVASEAPDFRGADLPGANFSKITLASQNFSRAILRGAAFTGCNLSNADFSDADLSGANFRGAKLENVDFSNANLTQANLYQASLLGAAFIGSNLFMTNFRETTIGQTTFANLDMETCIGLGTVSHQAPSYIGVECIYRSGHNLSLAFLKGVGLPSILIDYIPSLLQAEDTIQFHSSFISYSHTDEAFARRLWTGMRDENIRVWYAPEEMKGGKKLFEQIDRAIHLHDKLLLVLSKQSIASNWVQTEIRRARKQERLHKERKLFPIRLCDMRTLQEWECFDADTGQDIAQEIREYFIPDFSQWTKPNRFEQAFEKLLSDLRVEGVQMSTSTKPPTI